MGKFIRVTPEELGTASKKLTEISGTYTEIYQQLLGEAEGMGQAWQGDDNLAFVNRINGFLEELQAMAKKIESAGATLEAQRVNYVNRQQANIDAVNKLTN